VTGEDGLRAVELMSWIYRAAREGGRVLLAPRGSPGT
jgi:hypothetical protein